MKSTPEEGRLSEELRALQLDFDQVFKKHAMDYAEQKRLNLTIDDSFGDGDYLYIEKKRWHRRDVSYEVLKKAVATQFDKDLIAFVRPYTVIERTIHPFTGRGGDVIRFDLGQVRGLEDGRLIVPDIFRFELLRRYPNVDGVLFAKHAGKVEAVLKKQYQDQLSVPLWTAGRRTSLEHLLFDLHREAAKAKNGFVPAPALLGRNARAICHCRGG
jgi:hypothetical protein